MNLSGQIKKYRVAHGFSQEELAERIFVSRQTISNWETEKSFPDIQSLLMLSVLFDVSLDELVKGDLEMMKQTVDAHKMTLWTWVMLVGIVAGSLVTVPTMLHFGFLGLVFPGALFAIGLAAAIYIEILKKRHNVKTYSEILSFVEGGELDETKATREREHHVGSTALLALLFGLGGAALVVIGGIVYTLLV